MTRLEHPHEIRVRHATVFADPSMYAGWPANHGHWQRGDELLVGFLRGPWHNGGIHHITEPFQKVQARSLDGGETWAVEAPDVDFEARQTTDAPPFDLRTAIVRFCGAYDHGGEYCAKGGGFYLSHDFGHHWEGAFRIDGIGEMGRLGTSRTAVLPEKGLLFVSYAHRGFDDWVLCVEHDGHVFRTRSVVCGDSSRAVMPAVADTGSRLVCALRRRDVYHCWIDITTSDDDGRTWSDPRLLADTGEDNGNPPALVFDGTRLICAYANRTTQRVVLNVSDAGGESWAPEQVIRQGHESDIGYPRLFVRSDGVVVCVYYWSDAGEPQRIEASLIE